MAAARPIIGFLSLFLLAGGVLLLFFVILSGAVSGLPENKVFFLHANTNGLGTNAPTNSAWTYFSLCQYKNGKAVNCGSAHAAFPFDPQSNFNGPDSLLPPDFRHTSYYFLMSRFSWVFFLIALFFSVLALFTGLLGLCTRIGAYVTSFLAATAAFFQLIAAALMTAWAVKGRDHFRAAGRDAGLGEYAFGFVWASAACFLLVTVLFCIGGSVGKSSSASKPSRFGTFGRKRSTRSRSSFRENDEGGIKDEYS